MARPSPDPADCVLTPAGAARLAAGAGAALVPGSIEWLGEGQDNWAYTARDVAGADWLFRFPKRAEIARALEREIALLPRLAPRLPLPIPRFEIVGPPTPEFPHPFVGYRRLPGHPAHEDLEAPYELTGLGTLLGRFLAALHDFPVDDARQLGVVLDDDEEESEQVAREDLERLLVEAAPALSAEDVARLREAVFAPLPPRAALVLAHTDFFPEHFLVEAGRVTGVIDWTDAALGDPAVDLAGLLYFRGEPLFAAGLTHYAALRGLGPEELSQLAARARAAAARRALEDLPYGIRTGRHAYTQAALRLIRGPLARRHRRAASED